MCDVKILIIRNSNKSVNICFDQNVKIGKKNIIAIMSAVEQYSWENC